MSLKRTFSLGLLFLVFSCAGKKELIKEVKSGSHVIDSFYRGGVSAREPLSSKRWEPALQGSYEDDLGFVGRREVQVRVKDEEKMGDF